MYLFTEWSDPTPIGVAPIPSDYLLTFWTPIVGPSSVLVARSIGLVLAHQSEWNVEVADLGGLVGLRGEGRQSPISRTLRRLEQFGFLRWREESVVGEAYELRLTAPELSTRQVDQLPSGLKLAHGLRRQRLAAS